MSENQVFAELDEVMRQERIAKFWHENASAIIAFVVMTILATAAISGYKAWNTSVREKQTAKVLEALSAENFPANLDIEGLKLRSGLEALTALNAGGALVEEGKTEDALTYYETLSGDKSAPKDFRELGTLMTARLKAEQENVDNTSLVSMLAPVAKRKDSPWRYHAYLDMAVLSAGMQDYQKAREYLASIINAENLPNSLGRRASALDHVYKLKQSQTDTKGAE